MVRSNEIISQVQMFQPRRFTTKNHPNVVDESGRKNGDKIGPQTGQYQFVLKCKKWSYGRPSSWNLDHNHECWYKGYVIELE